MTWNTTYIKQEREKIHPSEINTHIKKKRIFVDINLSLLYMYLYTHFETWHWVENDATSAEIHSEPRRNVLWFSINLHHLQRLKSLHIFSLVVMNWFQWNTENVSTWFWKGLSVTAFLIFCVVCLWHETEFDWFCALITCDCSIITY